MQTVRQDLILQNNQHQLPAGTQQQMYLPNNIGVSQYVVATQHDLFMHQQVFLGGERDRPIFVQQNVVRRDAAHHMRCQDWANNNNDDRNRRQEAIPIPIPAAVHNDDQNGREAIPVPVPAIPVNTNAQTSTDLIGL